ncbi:exocyst complex component 7 isoform X6 [Labeo rohita]|uniref:Exocyst complex component 7 n=1 Tax=Labeo rohita TaxID=84645 RepID=A0A498LLN5_LABRO|nr:exocyst complex component 7 isoform X6 [Labeo rohita]
MIPTEDASARKREIEDKLKQEQETLSFIRESLEKSDQLTKGMVSILSSFESRLMQLENSIIPVHKQTENLQRLQENVDRTLSCLDHVISYYHVAKDTDKIIREGPAGRLDEYLACIAKIQKAVEYFQDNNPDSPELNTVKARFEKGKELLEGEFRSLLTRYSKPVPPVLILDAIGGDEDMEVQEDVALDHLPEAALQDIICISAWLVEYGRNQDFMNVYFQVRSSQLDRSIKGLKEHFRKNSATSAIHSPAVQPKRKETPTKKPPKRPGTIRKAQNLLKQYSQHGLDGKKGSNLTPLEGKDDVLDIEIDSYIHCISAFVKLAQSEYALLTEIIPEHHQKKTFDSLIQEALDNLMLEGDNIVSAARRAIMRHDYSAVLTIFPILRHLKQTKPDFDATLQGTAASTKNKLPALITSMETIGAKALEEFADSIKNDPDKEYNMPKDGTVHELTSNAILFLQQLLDFQETAGAMLASQESSSSASSYSSEFSRRLLSTYIYKVLGNLQLNLSNKAKVYEDPALRAIFLHNNYNYILKSLEKSELIQLVAVTHKKVEGSYRELIEQEIQNYQRSWLKVTEHLTERNIPAFQPGTKLKDKERQIIKDKFKGFNDGLEELCKIQQGWAVPDKGQRDAIRQAQKRVVSEAFRAFLQREPSADSFSAVYVINQITQSPALTGSVCTTKVLSLNQNPDFSRRPWCFVRTRPRTIIREECDIPRCAKLDRGTNVSPDSLTVAQSGWQCGQKEERSMKVVGGDFSTVERHPWMAAVFSRSTRAKTFTCGGSLISPCWVLTAAHCFPDGAQTNTNKLSVFLGKNAINETDVQREQEFTVSKLFIHENFDNTDGNFNNDIALLKIHGPDGRCAKESSSVKTICIPEAHQSLSAGTSCEVTGYGREQEGSWYYSQYLKEAKVNLLSHDACSSKEYYGNMITNNMLCAGTPDWSADSCKGDSGGPLVCRVRDRMFLFGVVSWGEGCARSFRPGVYAKVSNYHHWILQKTGLSSLR